MVLAGLREPRIVVHQLAATAACLTVTRAWVSRDRSVWRAGDQSTVSACWEYVSAGRDAHLVPGSVAHSPRWAGSESRTGCRTAVTGKLVVFDSAGVAGLVDAVAASCAVPGVWPHSDDGGPPGRVQVACLSCAAACWSDPAIRKPGPRALCWVTFVTWRVSWRPPDWMACSSPTKSCSISVSRPRRRGL
jgi:hypothetical protein